MTRKIDERFMREYDRQMLRSMFVSAYWAVFSDRKATQKLSISKLAKRLGRNKSVVSRWFSGYPNWEIDTMADIADALDVEVQVRLVSRSDGTVFSPRGKMGDTTTTGSFATMSPPSEGTTTVRRPIVPVTIHAG